jgi:hypothetical protein
MKISHGDTYVQHRINISGHAKKEAETHNQKLIENSMIRHTDDLIIRVNRQALKA